MSMSASTSSATAKSDTVVRYFETIKAALDGLDVYLGHDASPLTGHELTGAILAPYLKRLRFSFDAWESRLAYAKRFRINRGESGYPLHQHVLELENDAKTAQARLEALPSEDALRDAMVDTILTKGAFPTTEREALAERHYLERVKQGSVFGSFVLPETERLKLNEKSGRPSYVVHWGGFDGTANLPLVYIAVVEDSGAALASSLLDRKGRLRDDLDIPFPIGGLLNPDLADSFDVFAKKNSAYGLTLATIADNMDSDFETLHPKQLRRIVMGPFYSSGLTSHGRMVEKILAKVRNAENAWLLTWTEQELFAVSETPAKWGLFGSTPSKQTFHINTNDLEAVRQGVSSFQRHALVPHEAYQAIYASGKRDEVFAGYTTHVISGDQVLRDF
ncbi:MAG: hypothetical protein OXR62_11265 [Ahrensia sp.]|nr:hypothetical protein [Ahrensia sp.]